MRRLWQVLFLVAVAATLGQSCSPLDLLSSGGDTSTTDTSLTGINGGSPSTQAVPEVGAPISIQIVSQSPIDARVIIRYLVGGAESHLADLQVPAQATLEPVGPDLATLVQVTVTYADGRTFPMAQLRLGQEFMEGDTKVIVITNPDDACLDDPLKLTPGVCGCGVPDTDSDGDGTPDCIDLCPNDPAKIAPGYCGCGSPDIDSDHDGVLDCLDACPNDPHKTLTAGVCGCGIPDVDSDEDGILDCLDNCPNVYNPDQLDYDQDGVGNACEIRADLDFDGDVDLQDFGILQACLMNPGSQCEYANIDRDPDCIVDHADVVMFNLCFTGANVPLSAAPPACWGEEISRGGCYFGNPITPNPPSAGGLQTTPP